VRPVDVDMSYDDTTPARFDCQASTDDVTPLTVRWYRVREEKDFGGAGDQSVYNVTNKVLLGMCTRILIVADLAY